MNHYKLLLSYDGTRYRGWQRLPGVENTLQGKLETVLSRILGEPIEVSGSGRTDAGVHAKGQVASFQCSQNPDPKTLLADLRQYLPEDIGVLSCERSGERFHARLSAKGKWYRYTLWNSDTPCVFDRRYVYQIAEPLDIPAMERAAGYFVGTHDFRSFCTNPGKKKSTLRRIDSITLTKDGNYVYLDFRGEGFLYNMVRILTGTLLEVGTHKREADSIPSLFTRPRSEAGFTAPAQGLCLLEVSY